MVKSFLIFILSLSATEPAKDVPQNSKTKMTLSQKKVAEMVIAQSPRAREIENKYQQSRLPYVESLSAWDWTLAADSGFEKDNTETLATTALNYERFKTNLSLSKSFFTGTEASLTLSRTSQKSDQLTSNAQLTADFMTLSITQNLWSNAFGYGDRAKVESAEMNFRAQQILRANELQDLVLDGVKLFWKTYVSQEQMRQSLGARDRYEKLVAAVKKKSGLGYTSPGEYFQVQAELQIRIQKVKSTSQEYLKNLDQLTTFLGIPSTTEIDFEIPNEIPTIPQLKEVAIDELRIIKSQKLKLEASKADLSLAESQSAPSVDLVVKSSSSGVDESSSASYAELMDGQKNKLYTGIEFSYQFGSGLNSEKPFAKKAAVSLEDSKFNRLKQEVKDSLIALERKVSAQFTEAQSFQEQKSLRQKAYQELNKSYNQGRTDISRLIESMNALFDAEVSAVTSLGNYEISINEWAAARDELIPNIN
jgi:outer membrane protein TolC